MEINIITGSNQITLRKVNVKPYRFEKLNMGKHLIEDKLWETIDQFNERKIIPAKFYSTLLSKIHTFYNGNGTYKIVFTAFNSLNYI